jgi:hypothetical protein
MPSTTTESSFLPGTKVQWAWDSTSLGWLKDCPRKYQYSMIEGWRLKGDQVNLTFGLLYHQALEYYDKLAAGFLDDDGIIQPREEPVSHETRVRMVVKHVLNQSASWHSDSTSKNRQNLIRSIIWYLDEFANDNLETIVLDNGRPAVELSFKMELDWGPQIATGIGLGYKPYVLSGHLDRIVSFSGGTYVTDRKTTGSTISADYFGRFDLDNQMSLYTIAAQVIFHTPVRGVIIDGAQIAVGFTRFARGMTYRTPAQSEEWLRDLRHWLRKAEEFAEANHWPMNDRACFLCPFKRVCSKDPRVREQFLESDFERRPWNPLEVR